MAFKIIDYIPPLCRNVASSNPQWIQRRIDEALGSMDSAEINGRRRRDLETFLAITNTKTDLFRDIIIESGTTFSAHTKICSNKIVHTVIIKTLQ